MSDMELEPAFEGRRYSAVAVSHPELKDARSFFSRAGALTVRKTLSDDRRAKVTSYLVEWRHEQNLYPYGSALRDINSAQSSGTKTFTHRCLVASMRGASGSTPTFLFCSPHIRVVGVWAKHLAEAVDNPRPRYVAPRLDNLFDDLASTSNSYRATQITLQLTSNLDVDKVALTGKSPLISSLRSQLGPLTEPYAVRLDIPRAGRPLRLHLDRHGNFWWHQANEEAFVVAVGALASLGADGYFGSTHDLPHLRLTPPLPRREGDTRR